VERDLRQALAVLDERGITDVVKQRGDVLFDRRDVELGLQFQSVLKERFQKDLKLLDPKGPY
jgi:hypothetical protein